MKTILVPYDFSPYAEAALDFAVQIRKKTKGEIKLVNVIEYPLGSTFNVTGEIASYDPMDKVFTMKLIEHAKEKLANTIAKFEGEKEHITPIVLMGYPFDGITDQINETHTDLIVMGTKGATGLKEMFVGSNAEKIVRNAKCPVITIHQKRNISEINDIIYATELVVKNEDKMRVFKTYQEFFDAKIHLVWINTPHNTLNDDLAEQQLEKLAKSNQLNNYDVKVIRGFYPEEGILTYAVQIDANMIAMNTNSHKGLMHLFLGSVAEDVVNHSSVPVWTLTTND
jgi:nucleotide-binding universal stress UspA family protein